MELIISFINLIVTSEPNLIWATTVRTVRDLNNLSFIIFIKFKDAS